MACRQTLGGLRKYLPGSVCLMIVPGLGTFGWSPPGSRFPQRSPAARRIHAQ